MAGGSKKAVYAALFGNLGIAVTKFVAAFFTGSPSMFAEAYHSASDTFNQVLLLIGLRTSARVASDRHQFGYGKDMFFWSFIVATMLFGVSGVLSIEHGISSLLDPHTIENATISYVVLAIAELVPVACYPRAGPEAYQQQHLVKGVRGRMVCLCKH